MGRDSGAAGLAALAICEAILLSLTRNRVIDVAEARAILADAAAAHRGATPSTAPTRRRPRSSRRCSQATPRRGGPGPAPP